MFNGKVLLMRDLHFDEDTFRAAYFEVDFAAFLAFKEFGFPDPAIANGFAMGALRAADGAYVLGVMGPHTANRGRIYFPAGTPDRSDLTEDGRVDLAGSVLRELREETGLGEGDVTVGEGWTIVRDGPTIAYMRPVALAESAEAARDRIRGLIAAQPDPELADIVIVREPADIDEARMPRFLLAYLRDALAQR
ncbi:NUDIX hydrolase [Salinarimonas soli]|nr:NUDIX hydrolase [Salinarimonas soli]